MIFGARFEGEEVESIKKKIYCVNMASLYYEILCNHYEEDVQTWSDTHEILDDKRQRNMHGFNFF